MKICKMMIDLILIASMLLACKADPSVGPGEDTAQGTEERDELEVFNSMILKSDIEALPDDAYIVDAENSLLETVITFSNEQKMYLGKHYGAYVAQNEKGFITINGSASRYRVVDFPYHTISPEGYWVNQGEVTDTWAIPRKPAGADEPESPYLRYIRDSKKSSVAYFSDGSSIVIDKPEPVFRMYVRKTASQMDVYIGEADDTSYVKYPFKKRSKGYTEGQYPSYLDNWGIGALSLCNRSGDAFDAGTDLFLNGEAEMALQVTDGRDASKQTYVGGTLHGFENIISKGGMRQLTISVDGRNVAEGESFDLTEAKKIVMTQESELCQAYTKSDPFAKARRVWTFENGRLSIEIEVTFLRDMRINQGMFGMLCVLRRWQGDTSRPYLTRYAVKNNKPLESIDISDGWGSMSKDHATSKITEYGEKGMSFALVFDEGTYKDNGGMFVGTNGNAYNKIYLDLTGKYDAVAGEVLRGRVHWEIECL